MAKSKAHYNKVVPTHTVLDLSWEQLFYQPVSLKGLELEEDFDVDAEDFSYLLELDLESLFKIIYPVEQYQENIQEGITGEDLTNDSNLTKRTSSQGALNVEHVNEPLKVISEPIDTKLNNNSYTNKEQNELLPIVEQTTEESVEGPFALAVNETAFFVTGEEIANANLFDIAGLGAGPGVVVEILGVTDNGVGDLDPAIGTIAANTAYGYIEVDVNSGAFFYEYLDASVVPDAQQNVTEGIPYKIELFSDSTVVDYLFNVVIDLNQAPIAIEDSYQVSADSTLIVNTIAQGLLGNDTDSDNSTSITDTMVLTKINGDGNIFSGYVSLPGGGEIELNQNGTFTFDTNMDFSDLDPGEVEQVTFTYTIEDAEGLESTGQATIDVIGIIPPELNIPIHQLSMGAHQPAPEIIEMRDVFSSLSASNVHSLPVHLPELDLGQDIILHELI